ncbi:hypothetical protein AAF463_24470 (plasmid) [Pantoea sp. BJ2]|uniref:Uncharacterized protein n=1 Tax=Pantoea sp. BJ2 TaxID=3141322 RepID=A0AAU7U409_9GAMM
MLMAMMGTVSVQAEEPDLTVINKDGALQVQVGEPTFKHTLHYRKLYEEKPFPDAVIYYYQNGIYKIISQGEDHFGLYVLQGKFSDQSYTIRYISMPSRDWGKKTAYHQLTFVDGGDRSIFIQNAITDTGEQISQQNGVYQLENNTETNAANPEWSADKAIK